MQKEKTVEQALGIPADYQYKALRSGSFLQSNWHNNKLESLRSLVKPGMRILDLGTGSGNFELEFHHQASEIVGVDYNPEAVGFLKNKLKSLRIKNVKVIQSDIRNLNKQGILGKFDLVVMVDVIEHIRSREAVKVISDIREFLTTDGKVCVITPNYKSSWLLIENILDKYGLVPHLKGEQHLAKYDTNNLNRLFTKNGYKMWKISSFNLVSYLFPLKWLSKTVNEVELKSKFVYGNLLWGLFELK